MFILGNISFDSFLWFLASGKSFFWGTALLAVMVLFYYSSSHKCLRITCRILQIPMLLMIVMAATPLRPLFYILWLITLIVCQIRFKRKSWRFSVLALFIVFCITAISLESLWYTNKSITVNKTDSITIIGDSISAGMGSKDERTWTKQLSEATGIQTINLAKAGATVSTALKKQVPLVPTDSSLIIIEIGGNDLLNFNSTQTFKEDADEMLRQLQSAGHEVVWFELPLLPQFYSYGRIQRELAKKHNIVLIPKPVLAGVFNTPGATSDGMHLTEKGHTIMAAKIQKLLQIE